ncbi:MAG TPA: 3-keto-5-aminohexanoate cleavage protein [Rhizobium sp.]
MIVQACINGARPSGFHPRLPLTKEAMIRDSIQCVEAGASELHIHPRDADRRESLDAVDDLMVSLRVACPDTPIGVSTGAWIERNEEATRTCIANWTALPDYASVNLSEPDAPGVISLLNLKGVGVEAGLATVEDAKRFLTLADSIQVFRILIEIEEQNQDEADRIADDIAAVLGEAGISRPVLLHGFDATVWHFVKLARKRLWSTRVGLEDGRILTRGGVAESNADLVAEAVEIFRRQPE